MRNILITGATGFIGEHVAPHLLAAGCDVHVLMRQNSNSSYLPVGIKIYNYDRSIENLSEYLIKNRIECVIHLVSLYVAEHRTDQIDDLVDSNIKFGTQLLEAMRQAGVTHFINTGTSWQHFGARSPDYRPVNLYAATKQAFENIIDYYVEACSMKAITLTVFDSYGKGDRRGKLISLLGEFADRHEKLSLSPGGQQLGLLHIDDITAAFGQSLSLVEQQQVGHNRYALNPKEIYTLKEVVEIFERVTGKKIEIQWGGRPYRDREVMEIWQCGRTLPGWEPRIALEDGFGKLFNRFGQCK